MEQWNLCPCMNIYISSCLKEMSRIMVQFFPAMPWDHSLFPRGLIRLTALSSLPLLLNNSLAAQKFSLHRDVLKNKPKTDAEEFVFSMQYWFC